MLKDLVQKLSIGLLHKPIFDFPTLEDGDIDPVVLGTGYSQPLLRSLYKKIKDSRTLLTLTPINQHQIKNKWPEPPFVNVNLYGSASTEKENWLGYIPIDPIGINFETILEEKGNVNVHASIHRDYGREYYIKLYISDKYNLDKSKYVDAYISHDKSQIKFLEELSCESGNDYVKVNMKKSSDKKHYSFTYRGTIIGTATCKKIDELIGDSVISDKLLAIKKFRFDDGSDNKHYSRLIMIKET